MANQRTEILGTNNPRGDVLEPRSQSNKAQVGDNFTNDLESHPVLSHKPMGDHDLVSANVDNMPAEIISEMENKLGYSPAPNKSMSKQHAPSIAPEFKPS